MPGIKPAARSALPGLPVYALAVKIPFLASLAIYGVDKFREAFDMALESCFGAFDADEVARRSHRHRIPS